MNGRNKKRKYEVILSECGMKTRIRIYQDFINIDMTIRASYRELKEKLEGKYVEGLGVKAEVEFQRLTNLAVEFGGLWELVDEIMRQEEAYYEFEKFKT